jgi:ATP-dependent DNA helicase RecQ
VVVGSNRRPQLVASIGERIAAIGRLPLLGTVDPVPGAASGVGRANCAQRVRAVHAAFRVRPELRAQLETLTGPVLLVDDVVDSGWTMAIVGRQLREAGSPGVLPFALALVS